MNICVYTAFPITDDIKRMSHNVVQFLNDLYKRDNRYIHSLNKSTIQGGGPILNSITKYNRWRKTTKLNRKYPALHYDPQEWKRYKTHNCYAYALNYKNKKHSLKQQPGHAAALSGNISPTELKILNPSKFTCQNMTKRLFLDNPHIRKANASGQCPIGYFRVFLILHPNNDYHWLRQGPDGIWTHKRGASPVGHLDASGKLIFNPQKADFDYSTKNGGTNYYIDCFYFCIPEKEMNETRAAACNSYRCKHLSH